MELTAPDGSDPLDQPTTGIVREAQADRTRFSDLYRRVAPSVYAWASLKLRPPLNSVLEPEDVVQEVWCRALEGLDGYDPDRASFRTWVFAIANHVMLKAWRSLKGRPPGGAPLSRDGVFSLSQVPDEATSVSRAVGRDEGLRRCVDRLRELDDDERSVLIHCGLEGLSAPEASTLVGASPDAVAKRWQRLRARLRDASAFKDLLAP